MQAAASEKDRAYESAKWAYREHRYSDALTLLEKVDAQDEGRFVHARARCLLKLGREQEALASCTRLTHEFDDPRGQRLAEKIQASMAATTTPAQVEPAPKHPVKHRRLWAFAASLVVLGALACVAAYAYIGHRATAPVVAELTPETPAKEIVAPQPVPIENPSTPPRSKDLLRLDGIDHLFERENADADRSEIIEPEPQDLQLASYASPNRARTLAARPVFDGPNEIVQLTQVAQVEPPPVAPVDVAPRLVNSVLDLQSFKTEQRLSNARGDSVALINLNPNVNAWYLIEVNIGGQSNTLHLEVPALRGDPMKRPKLSLCRDGLLFSVEGKDPLTYPLWAAAASNAPEPLDTVELNSQPIMPDVFKSDHAFTSAYNVICDGMVIIRSQKAGVATRLESATDLLRETRIGGWFVEKAKPYLIPEPEMGDDGHGTATAQAHSESYPLDAQVDESQLTLFGSPQNLGIETDAPDKKIYYGRWYKAVKHPHVFVSMMKPTLASKAILESYKDRVGVIGSRDRRRREAEALVYLVAYDLRYFRFGYALGADHPKLDWSPRATHSGAAKGPDGFDSRKPLSTIGALPPYYSPYIAATFTGGFKREHGAFKDGAFSRVNSGSHFGFMEQGTVFSTLKPGLASIVIGLDGSFNMVTWPNETPPWFTKLAHVRQNCVPLIEGRDANGISMPGTLVNDWGAGSWSGDQAGDFVTLRGSAAMQESSNDRFLLFAYFTGATPNAMARTFQAYRCSYAMLLDMNTPNYCFTALYTHDPDGKVNGVEYLHKEMAANNGQVGDLKFLQRNDTRDFFYALRIPERP